MSHKYRLFGKIPVADIIIVLLLGVVLLAGGWLILRDDVQLETGADAQSGEADTVPVTATLCVTNTDENNVSLVSVGDELFYKEGGYFGKVLSVSHKPYTEYKVNGEGQYVATEMKGRANIYLTTQIAATAKSEHGIYVGDDRVFYTDEVTLCNEKYYWKMTVVQIDREEAAE